MTLRIRGGPIQGEPIPPARTGLVSHRVRNGAVVEQVREIASECAVAMTFNRTTHAVMMATPADLEDFALGFALAEGIVEAPGDIEELEIVGAGSNAVECRAWIAPARMAALDRRRRHLAGVTGCGMCGLESLAEAMRPVPAVADGKQRSTIAEIARAAASLRPAQALNRATGAVHAAGFWRPSDGLVCLREDVGRHNALDKLGGALARDGIAAGSGILLLTSRISVELVQKAARMGAPVLVAVSAPTALAIEVGAAAGITLVGIARDDGFEIFTRPDRIVPG